MISVIVCTYNRADSLRVVIEDLLNQDAAGIAWELLIVDNNSSDQTEAIVRSFLPQTRLHLHYLFEPRQGKAFALNTGIAAAQGDVLAFTDDDVRVGAGWVRALDSAFQRGDCDLACGRIRPIWPVRQPDWYNTTGRYALMSTNGELDLGESIVPTRCAPFGANMAVRKSLIDAWGGFRTDLGPKGPGLGRQEDTELGRRLMKAGAKCLYVPDAAVDHVVQERNTTRSYVRRWYFNYGRSSITASGVPPGPRVFGVPRFLLLDALRNLTRWLTAFEPRRRFFYQLQTCQAWGSIVQCRRDGSTS